MSDDKVPPAPRVPGGAQYMNGRLVKEADNVIRLKNDGVIPEIMAREGRVTLYYGEGHELFSEAVELSGTITLSEVCFLHKLLGWWIDNKLDGEQ